MEGSKFRNIHTGDESRFAFEYQHSAKWSVFREDVPSRVRQDIGTKMFMLIVSREVDGFHVVDLMTSQRSFNSEYFVNHGMAPTITKVFPQGRAPHARRQHLHLDNCRVHFSKNTQQFMSESHILHVLNPPYSPDHAPSDFWLFGHAKTGPVARGSRSQKNFSRPMRSF
jgi:hypothetical protein